MDGHARANQLKPSGIAHKELVLKNLLSTLSAKRLDAITDEDVQQLKYRLRHRKPRMGNNVLTVLSMMLKKAGEWRVTVVGGGMPLSGSGNAIEGDGLLRGLTATLRRPHCSDGNSASLSRCAETVTGLCEGIATVGNASRSSPIGMGAKPAEGS